MKISAGLTILAGTVAFSLLGCAPQQPPPPVVVQAAPTPVPTLYIPPDPYADLSGDEVWAIQHNDLRTLYHGITTVYAYSPDTEYPLHCQRLHVTEIRLRPDEVTNKDNVKIGDKDRWGVIVGDHTVLVFPTGSSTSISLPGAQMTIPADPDMVTNLAIHTSLGNDYIFDPVRATSKKDYDRAVAFYYPESVRQQAAEREAALKQENKP